MDKESRNAFIVIGASLAALLVIGIVFSGRAGDAIYSGPPIHEQYQIAEAAGAAPAHGAAHEAPADDAAPDAQPADDASGEAVPAEEAPAEEAPAEEAPAEAAPAEGAEVEAAPAEAAPAGEAPADEASAEEPAAGTPAEAAPAQQEAPAEEAPAEQEPAPEGAPPADDAPAAEGAPQEVALAGDPEAGARVFRQCQACHQVGEGAQDRVGPALTDILERPIASLEGFRYSNALLALGQEGRVWSAEELHGYLSDPRGYAPGTSMAFAGLRSAEDIDDVIAYLATAE